MEGTGTGQLGQEGGTSPTHHAVLPCVFTASPHASEAPEQTWPYNWWVGMKWAPVDPALGQSLPRAQDWQLFPLMDETLVGAPWKAGPRSTGPNPPGWRLAS